MAEEKKWTRVNLWVAVPLIMQIAVAAMMIWGFAGNAWDKSWLCTYVGVILCLELMFYNTAWCWRQPASVSCAWSTVPCQKENNGPPKKSGSRLIRRPPFLLPESRAVPGGPPFTAQTFSAA